MQIVVRVVFAAIAYFASARLGYAFAIPNGPVTLWPPSGIMLALLASSERRHWPAFLLGGLAGSFLSDLVSGYSLALAVVAALANSVESLVAAWVVTLLLGQPVRLEGLRSVLVFTVGAAVVSNAVTAWLGAAMLSQGFHMPLMSAWFVWWVGDGLGMLIVAPVVIALAHATRRGRALTTGVILEGLLLVAALYLVSTAALGPARAWLPELRAYTVFPLLFWASLRFGSVGAATSAFIVAAIATWYASLGVGPFAAPEASGVTVVLHVYTFLVVVSLSSLIPGAVLEDRRVAERRLRESEARYRDAESRMRFALEASRVGTWDLDFATGTMRCSSILEALHGLSPEAFGGTFEAFLAQIHADDQESVRKEIDEATKQHRDANLLYRVVWPNGGVRWISGLGRAFYDSNGAPVRAAGIGLDITDRRQLEEQYRQAQKMEAVGHLAGGVAHDFNNLLTAIQNFASFIGESLASGDARRGDVDEILRASERAASLTRQLLAFSRQQILEPRVLDLADAVRTMEPMLTRLIGEDIEVVVRSASDSGRVKADPGQIEQVVLNLAINARDAMPNGGVLLIEVTNAELEEDYVRSHIEAKAGPYVMLAVTDTGVGMDAATAARVFEPFFTTKPAGRGTGLGLSTVYGIVKQSGGHVLVYSEPGRGTTFKVYLPRLMAEVRPSVQAPATAFAVASETVLVVEDNEAIRELARRILAKQGYHVLPAASPNEALDIASKHEGRIDLLLTDVVLPGMSGRALAEELVQRRPEVRVLYMSGYTDDAVVQRGVLEQATQFIQKPFGPTGLLQKVREALDQ